MPTRTIRKTRTLKVEISMTIEVMGDSERALNFQARDVIPQRLNFVAGAIGRNLLALDETIKSPINVREHYGTPADDHHESILLATVTVSEVPSA